tara:strand:+ start:376 stop:549 length:174 start_codon:yes stop_codon:yes gene_type:complete
MTAVTPLALATISAALGGALIGRFADDTPLYALGGLVVAIGGYEFARRKTEFQETNA